MEITPKKSILKLPKPYDLLDVYSNDYTHNTPKTPNVSVEKRFRISTGNSDSQTETDDYRPLTLPVFSPTNLTKSSSGSKKSKVVFKLNSHEPSVGHTRSPSPSNNIVSKPRILSAQKSRNPSGTFHVKKESQDSSIQKQERSASPASSQSKLAAMKRIYNNSAVVRVPSREFSPQSQAVLPIEAELNMISKIGIHHSRGVSPKNANSLTTMTSLDNITFTKDNDDAKLVIQELRSAKKKLEAKLQRLEVEKNSEIAKENEQLKKDNEIFLSKIKIMSSEMEKIKLEKKGLQDKLTSLTEHNIAIEIDYKNLEKDYKLLHDDHEKLIKTNALARNKVYQNDIKYNKITEELENLKKSHAEEIEKLVQSQKEEIDKIKIIHKQEIENIRNVNKEVLKNLNSDLARANSNVSTLLESLKEMQSLKDKYAYLLEENNELKKKSEKNEINKYRASSTEDLL